jgi:hypothetical protein
MGTINIEYRPGNGVFVVSVGSNKGGLAVAKFLDAHRKYFGIMPSNNNKIWEYWIEGNRVGKFKLYAQSKGFEVVSPR